jgi:thioredoxin-related protein
MRYFLILSLFALTLFSAPLEWHEGYEQSFQQAQKSHKPLMLFLTQPHCKTCAFMKNDVLTNKTVSSYLKQHFIVAELPIQSTQLPKRYRVDVSPVFTFVDPENGEIIEQISGGRKAQRFLETLESVVSDYSEPN